MKRLIFAVLLTVFAFTPNAHAAWTTVPRVVVFGDYAVGVEVDLISDGSASGNLSLKTIIGASDFGYITGGFLMSIDVIPGTGDVAPNGTYTVDVYNDNGALYVSETTSSASSIHSYSTSKLTESALQIMNDVVFAIGDIGDSGDKVKVRFNVYRPVR